MATKITTETGRTYLIEDHFWTRLPKVPGERTDGPNAIWSMKHGTVFGWPWDAPEAWEDGLPKVGEFFYVADRDHWWTSTRVTSVEDVPDTESNEG